MTYEEFLRRVQEQAGLSSPDQAGRAVAATFETLRACFVSGGALPAELRQVVPAELTGAASQTGNPQLVGETRVESGGESTAESGQ